MLSIVMF